MGWTNDQTDSLTLPPGATGAPRIFLGGNDPFALAAGAVAAIMLYWLVDEAFMIWIKNTSPTQGFFQIANTDATGIVAEYVTGTYDESNGNATLTLGFVDTFEIVATTVLVNGSPIGGGGSNPPTSYDYRTTNSAAIGATETVILTIPSTLYTPGRAYELKVGGRVQGSVANAATFRARLGTTTGGVLFATFGAAPVNVATANGAAAVDFSRYVQVDAGDPPLTSAIVITMFCNTGTATAIAGANEPFYAELTDVGINTDFPFAIFL